jgi:hypothetical protein
MRLSNDLREFLELLNLRGINYVIGRAHSVSKDALIRNQRAAGRHQDFADLDTLES